MTPPIRFEGAFLVYPQTQLAGLTTARLIGDFGPGHATTPAFAATTAGLTALSAWVAWRKGRDPVGWTCAAYISFWTALVLLLAVRPTRARKGCYRPCARCGEFNRWRSETCAACGEPVSAGDFGPRALDLSDPVAEASARTTAAGYGAVAGVFALLASTALPSPTWLVACLCLAAACWLAAWGIPRGKGTAARAVLVLVAAGLIAAAAVLPVGLLAATAVMEWPVAWASLAVLRRPAQDFAVSRPLAAWRHLLLRPPPELVPPSARLPTDGMHHASAAWNTLAVVLGMVGGIMIILKHANLLPFLLATASWRHALRLRSLSASQLRERDGRRPVLLFRSFLDENLNVEPGWMPGMQILPWTLEMVIADLAWRCGPVVCIGQPGTPLPPLGFARETVDEAEWRLTANRWIEESRLAFVVAAHTAGVAWELNTLAAARGLEHVVVVIPPVGRKELRLRWAYLLNQLAAPVRARLQPVRVDRALAVVFPREGQVRVFTSSRRGRRAYEVALQAAAGYVLCAGGDLASDGFPPRPPLGPD